MIFFSHGFVTSFPPLQFSSNWLQTPSNPRNRFAFLGILLFLPAPCFPQPRILLVSPNEKYEIHNLKLNHSYPTKVLWATDPLAQWRKEVRAGAENRDSGAGSSASSITAATSMLDECCSTAIPESEDTRKEEEEEEESRGISKAVSFVKWEIGRSCLNFESFSNLHMQLASLSFQ
ncbi:hypothetical protein ACFXTN_020831 [Malus domestica]